MHSVKREEELILLRCPGGLLNIGGQRMKPTLREGMLTNSSKLINGDLMSDQHTFLQALLVRPGTDRATVFQLSVSP